MRAAPFFLALFILIGGVFAAFQNINTLSELEGEPTPRPTVTPRPRPTAPPTPTPRMVAGAPATPEPAPQATETPQPAGTAQPSPTQATATTEGEQIATVANTGGAGVYLRRTPRMADTIRPYVEGTQMVVVGAPVSAEGRTWLHVRAPDGTVGYIPEQWARVEQAPQNNSPPGNGTATPAPTPTPIAPQATATPQPAAQPSPPPSPTSTPQPPSPTATPPPTETPPPPPPTETPVPPPPPPPTETPVPPPPTAVPAPPPPPLPAEEPDTEDDLEPESPWGRSPGGWIR
jgi:hypothetical protein